MFTRGFSGSGTQNKRRSLNRNASGRKEINECSDADAKRTNMRLLEAFVDHAWPFTALDNKGGKFYDAILELRPGPLSLQIDDYRTVSRYLL